MGEEPDAKRQRLDFKLQPEDEFLEAYPGASKVRVQAPDVDDSDTLNGQVLELEVTALTDSVGDLKTRLAEVSETLRMLADDSKEMVCCPARTMQASENTACTSSHIQWYSHSDVTTFK